MDGNMEGSGKRTEESLVAHAQPEVQGMGR